MRDRIREAHAALGLYLEINLEEFELGFLRDADPASELAQWERIAAAFRNYVSEHCPRPPALAEGAKLLHGLLALSLGINEGSALGIAANTFAQLRACYNAPIPRGSRHRSA
jgi:hypothetical protein